MAGSKKVGGSRAPPLKKKTKSTKSTMATKRSEDKAPPTPSRLLALPPELRNRIFRYALISDQTIRVGVQSYSSRGRIRRRFDMLPGLINVSKQIRHETQSIFFKENKFGITPEVSKERIAAPLFLLRIMHHNVGLEFHCARFCLEMKRRVEGELFQVKATFTITFNLDVNGNSTLNVGQIYATEYIGRSHISQPLRSLGTCGCEFDDFSLQYSQSNRTQDVTGFLRTLKKRNEYLYVSCHPADLSRTDEVIYRSERCSRCHAQGRFNMWF